MAIVFNVIFILQAPAAVTTPPPARETPANMIEGVDFHQRRVEAASRIA